MTRGLLVASGLWLGLGCADDETPEPMLDLPVAAAVLPEAVGGFDEPVGYVASGNGGQVGILHLREGRYFTDHDLAAFLPTPPLATGQHRQLTSVAVWAPDDQTADLFVGDAAFGHLLQVPHVVGLDDGVPVRAPTRAQPPMYHGEASPAPRVDDIETREGFTTTEVWTLTSDGQAWEVQGSRSGRQRQLAVPDEPWEADRGALRFTVDSAGLPGDTIEIHTETGVDEHDVAGIPIELAVAPDQVTIAMIVQDKVDDSPVVRWFDPHEGAVIADTELHVDSWPHTLTFSPDGRLFVADAGHEAVWEVEGPEDEAVEHALPWPVAHVATLWSEEAERLFLAPVGASTVWVYELLSQDLQDLNPWEPGTQGRELRSPIGGLEAIPVRYPFPHETAQEIQPTGRSVAVSLASGRVVFMEEESGCLVRDQGGPRTERVPGFSHGDHDMNFREVTGPFLQPNELDNRHVRVNDCGGVALSETWTARFDENLQAWRVEGSISGPQENLAIEDQRYISDEGAVSFLIRSGTRPSRDGWRIRFRVMEGVVSADGDNLDTGDRQVALDFPGRPVYFEPPEDLGEEGWQPIEPRPQLLVPAAGSDKAVRVDVRTGDVDIAWR